MAEEGAITQKCGYLDVKQPACVKGRKLKSWKRRWVAVTKMADLTTGTPTAKLDLFTHRPSSHQGQGRDADRLTFVLEQVTNVRPCRSRTRPFAFEVVQDTAVLVLSGSSELESSAWMAALCNIFFADRRASLATDSYSVTIYPSRDSERLGLRGTFTLCVGPEAVSLMTSSPAQADRVSSLPPSSAQRGAVSVGTWTLPMLKRFRVEREPLTALPRIFLLHCGPNSPCGEAIFHFLSDEADNILASVRKVISVAMATRKNVHPSVMKTGSEGLAVTTTGHKAEESSVPVQRDAGFGATPASDKTGQRSMRSGSGSGSSLCSVTPRSSLSEVAPDSGGESPAEESLQTARGQGTSVNSMAGSVTSLPQSPRTSGHSGQVLKEHLAQQWQAERDLIWQQQQQQHPLQHQLPGQLQQQQHPLQQQQHCKGNSPQPTSQQPKETWTAQPALILHKQHGQQQQQQQRGPHEQFQHKELQGTQQQSQQQQHSQHQQQDTQQVESMQHRLQEKSSIHQSWWQQQQQQSDPWPTQDSVSMNVEQRGQSWEPQWPLQWQVFDGQSELVTNTEKPERPMQGWESVCSADSGVVLTEQASRPGPDGDSHSLNTSAVSVESGLSCHKVKGAQPVEEDLCSALLSSLTAGPAIPDDDDLTPTVADASLSNTHSPANGTGPFPPVLDPPSSHRAKLRPSARLETSAPASYTDPWQWEADFPANRMKSCPGETDGPANEKKACQCDGSCACPADHTVECGYDSNKQHVYQSLENFRDEAGNMDKGRLSVYGQGLGRKSLSTGDVSREHHYEELDALRTGKEKASRAQTMSVVNTPPDLPARPPFFLWTRFKSQPRTKITPALDFLSGHGLRSLKNGGNLEETVMRETQTPCPGDMDITLSATTDHYSIIDDDCTLTRRCISLDGTPLSSHFHPHGAGTTVLKTSQTLHSTGILESVEVPSCSGALSISSEPLEYKDASCAAQVLGSPEIPESLQSSDATKALIDFFLNDSTFPSNPMVTGKLTAAKPPPVESAPSDSCEELGMPPVDQDLTNWAHAVDSESASCSHPWPMSPTSESRRQNRLSTACGLLSSPAHTHISNNGEGGKEAERVEGVYIEMNRQTTELQEDSDYVCPSQLSTDEAVLSVMHLH